jgi:hypothetical protein
VEREILEGVRIEVEVEPEILLYREMDTEGGGPIVGRDNFALGVRIDGPPQDIAVLDGYVEAQPDKRWGGLSVAPHDARNLNSRHKPPELGGTGSYPVWRLSTRDLGPKLRYRPTGSAHGVIEPAYRMTITEYEEAIEATQKYWTRVIG